MPRRARNIFFPVILGRTQYITNMESTWRHPHTPPPAAIAYFLMLSLQNSGTFLILPLALRQCKIFWALRAPSLGNSYVTDPAMLLMLHRCQIQIPIRNDLLIMKKESAKGARHQASNMNHKRAPFHYTPGKFFTKLISCLPFRENYFGKVGPLPNGWVREGAWSCMRFIYWNTLADIHKIFSQHSKFTCFSIIAFLFYFYLPAFRLRLSPCPLIYYTLLAPFGILPFLLRVRSYPWEDEKCDHLCSVLPDSSNSFSLETLSPIY